MRQTYASLTEAKTAILEDVRAYDGELTVVYPLVRIYGREVAEAALNELRLEKKVRLVAISDYRDATAEQLADSIEGVCETIFYVKAV